jgi:hypothetical protein
MNLNHISRPPFPVTPSPTDLGLAAGPPDAIAAFLPKDVRTTECLACIPEAFANLLDSTAEHRVKIAEGQLARSRAQRIDVFALVLMCQAKNDFVRIELRSCIEDRFFDHSV